MIDVAELRIGTSGWRYPSWRGDFYPRGLVQRRELEYLASRMNSAEINGTFYSLQRPERYRAWAGQTPDDFVFAVKGGRFITHQKRLRDVETPLSNFFASGVLALGRKLGPILWQLPPRLEFDAERVEAFFKLLPRTSHAAAKLASGHDDKLKAEAHTDAKPRRKLRHALEVRHPSFAEPESIELFREHGIALVVADTAGKFPFVDEMTSEDFAYVRLHGAEELYVSGYGEKALKRWARRIEGWGRDTYVYFDNDVEAEAPKNAIALAKLLS
ncbi:DUF72 domain-containing protein [Amycolatopsis oliviviridis]|uniref:DUF72 domain-containing protein n=1 Tax=Amycolatopsis oliviviridis TaxID=1471590 RepID=A0ABQ3LSM7_9PSEU|nr:DUF72 domain-containing protein [Amycolatopsis oliviviridis]GHH24897.1 hypothetical protein GCM10017790_49900 [Amycolatopsis oliviviridis]